MAEDRRLKAEGVLTILNLQPYAFRLRPYTIKFEAGFLLTR
jgi:hypothetical protein